MKIYVKRVAGRLDLVMQEKGTVLTNATVCISGTFNLLAFNALVFYF
jgi:hypothetical protein